VPYPNNNRKHAMPKKKTKKKKQKSKQNCKELSHKITPHLLLLLLGMRQSLSLHSLCPAPLVADDGCFKTLF
jgi:hypothetical protein